MVATHFSGPIIAPGVGSRFSSPWATHYFVDADDGTDGDGKTPDAAFTTIQAAVTAAQYQDIIYIRPRTYTLGTGFARYVEDVTVTLGGSGGSGATATNANMSLIGITPNAHPSDFLGVRWKYTSATCLTVDAPCLHVENIGFFTEAATYAINLRCNGATRTQEGTTGFSIYNCAIKGDGALYGNGCTEIQIIKCRFQAKYDGTTGGINLVGTTNAVYRPIIKDCDFVGGNANAMATAPIIGASPWYTAVLANLWFDKDTTAGQFVAIGGTTSTGVCGPCFCGSGDISTTSFDTAGIEVVGAFDDDGIQNGADA
jgi:hypothetical protein